MRESKRSERKIISERDILERMRECWERLRFNGKLSRKDENLIDYNFSLIRLYCDLKPENARTTFVCGFNTEDEDESEEEEEEEEGGENDSGKDR